MRRIGLCALAVLCGPLAGSAPAHHPEAAPPELAPAVERVLGPEAEPTNNGLVKVPLDDGSVIRTHGPDLPVTDPAALVAGGPSDRFLPGGPERAPVCASDHAMQVLYARPPGTADAFAASAPVIRSTVRRSNQILNDEAIASGGGGGDYKVVCDWGGEVSLEQFTTTGTTFSQVVSSAKAAGYTSAARNYVVFLDASASGVCGVGSLYLADSPGLSNPHNTNGGYSVIYKDCWNGTTFMHEVGHNRGAVQPAAPHSTGSGAHCNDGYDVMCYAPDGGDRNQSMTYPCRAATLFDCGYDDYFDAAPEPGEYLASHWNVGTRDQNFLRITAATSQPEPGDTVAPDTSLTSGPHATSRKKTATFAFEGTDDTSAGVELAFECSIDGGPFAGCLSPKAFNVKRGTHRFEVRAVDEAGNVDPAPAVRVWKVRR